MGKPVWLAAGVAVDTERERKVQGDAGVWDLNRSVHSMSTNVTLRTCVLAKKSLLTSGRLLSGSRASVSSSTL